MALMSFGSFSLVVNSMEVENVIHSDNDFATVAFLRIKKAELVPKVFSKVPDIPVPPLLEESFSGVKDTVTQFIGSPSAVDSMWRAEVVEPIGVDHRAQKIDNWVSVANIERRLGESVVDISIEDEVTECFMLLKGQF
jgi:diphthine-ammonia ligase